MSRLPIALTSSILPFLTPGMVASLTGAAGAVPGGAAGVTVGAGIVPESGVAEVVLGGTDAGAVGAGGAGAGAFAAGAFWLGAVEGGGALPLDCAKPTTGASTMLAKSANCIMRVSFAKSLRIPHLVQTGR